MKRKALIIGYTGDKTDTETYKKGILNDIGNSRFYLQSFHSGAWNDDEIEIAKDESKASIIQKIKNMDGVDYSLIIFTGHGKYNFNRYETEMYINSKETICESELYTQSDRRLIIMDCCRKIPAEDKTSRMIESSVNFAREDVRQDLREIYRRKFEDELSKSVKGLIKVYACGIDEYSNARNFGGLFLYNFLKQCSGKEDLSVYKVLEKTIPIVSNNTNNEQNPDIQRPRSGISFPFYIA